MLLRLTLTAALALVPIRALADAACQDYASDTKLLQSLEADASRGALSDALKSCLEASYASASAQTTKNKISRVLMVNAYAYDTSDWARLVKRHLKEVDQSDPNVAYLYAFYLYNQPTPDFEGVIRWVNVALERRGDWKGKVFVLRTYQLLRTKSLAAAQLWRRGAESGQPSELVEEQRNRAKTYAREWLDSTRSAKGDIAESRAHCVSIASLQACGLE